MYIGTKYLEKYVTIGIICCGKLKLCIPIFIGTVRHAQIVWRLYSLEFLPVQKI